MGEMGRRERECGVAGLLNPERHIQSNEKDGFSSSLSPAGMAVVEPWANVWDFKDFLPGLPELLPCAPARLRARFPRFVAK